MSPCSQSTTHFCRLSVQRSGWTPLLGASASGMTSAGHASAGNSQLGRFRNKSSPASRAVGASLSPFSGPAVALDGGAGSAAEGSGALAGRGGAHAMTTRAENRSRGPTLLSYGISARTTTAHSRASWTPGVARPWPGRAGHASKLEDPRGEPCLEAEAREERRGKRQRATYDASEAMHRRCRCRYPLPLPLRARLAGSPVRPDRRTARTTCAGRRWRRRHRTALGGRDTACSPRSRYPPGNQPGGC